MVGERNREGGRGTSRLRTEHEAQRGDLKCNLISGPWDSDPEIMTWDKIKSLTLNWLSHPGTPPTICFYLISPSQEIAMLIIQLLMFPTWGTFLKPPNPSPAPSRGDLDHTTYSLSLSLSFSLSLSLTYTHKPSPSPQSKFKPSASPHHTGWPNNLIKV